MQTRHRTLVVLCVALTSACVRNPATGKRQLNLVSRDQEIAMGKQGAQDVAASVGLYGNRALDGYVQGLGRRLVATSERQDLPWTFHVVDDASVNAFALPGGFVFVTRGLLAHMENEAQLATVMGHEIGHVTAEHSVNQMSKAKVAEAGLGIGLGVGSAVFGPLGTLGGLTSEGLQLLFLKFSRDDESQADDLGLRYASRAGYDVREMPKVFTMLGRVSQSQGGGRLPTWLETHPDPEQRVVRSERKIAAMDRDFSGATKDEAHLMQVIDGLVYGDNPREGFFKDGRFYHPDLAFSVAFPAGFQGNNIKQAATATSPDGDAAVQLSLGPNLTPEMALALFVKESGVRPQSDVRKLGPVTAASFQADTNQGPLAGLIGYVEHRGKTFQLLAVTAASSFGHYENSFAKSLASFQAVSDPAVLDVRPNRLYVAKLAAPEPVSELAKDHNSPLSAKELAILNQADEGSALPKGGYVKWVAPERSP